MIDCIIGVIRHIYNFSGTYCTYKIACIEKGPVLKYLNVLELPLRAYTSSKLSRGCYLRHEYHITLRNTENFPKNNGDLFHEIQGLFFFLHKMMNTNEYCTFALTTMCFSSRSVTFLEKNRNEIPLTWGTI